MSPRSRRVVVVTSGIAALAAAFAAGRSSVPPALPVECPEVEASVRREVVRVAPADLSECNERLTAAVGLLDAIERERLGTPVPFPADLAPQYTAAGFEAAVREALALCPDSPLKLAHVDCAEFPCMAFFSQPTGLINEGPSALAECPAWKERFDSGGQANAGFMTEAGRVEYAMLCPRPVDAPFGDDDWKRQKARLEDGRAALMDLWGGREPTPLEDVDQSLAFFREHGDVPGSRDIIARLEAQRAALVAEGEE